MSIKKRIIEILEENRGTSISGQRLAECLSVSRTAVWKAVRGLLEDGHEIEAVTNKGYRLKPESDVLSIEGIRLMLEPENREYPIYLYRQIDSTNLEAKRKVLEGAGEGTLILAEEQSKGRGRLGRSFASPSRVGVYMSLILKPELEIKDAILITTAAAVAVCRAIRSLTNTEPTIKWVNDIYLENKKICGILTEAVSNFETGRVDSVILGIGINVKTRQEQFPEDVRDVAGAIDPDLDIPRNVFAAVVMNEFMHIYRNIRTRGHMEDYRRFSNVLGEAVKYLEKDIWYYARAVDIDEDGGLIVEDDKGRRTLSTGEITLRKV